MSDRELLDALSLMARRLGLLDEDERLEVVSVHASAPVKLCADREWGTNGHRMSCRLTPGHEGQHVGEDFDGSVVRWPCPCYPDCAGHRGEVPDPSHRTP